MRKTIANRLYDTATAKAMGNWQRGLASERGHISETLYLKKTGEYFLYCQGGSRSRYAQKIGPNTWASGERIIPVSEEEAHTWAENHLTDAAYNVIFNGRSDEAVLTPLTLMLKAATIERLNRVARERDHEPYEIVEELLAKHL